MHRQAPTLFHYGSRTFLVLARGAMLVALVALLGIHAPRSADAQGNGVVGIAAAVAPVLNYQGRLAEPGSGAAKPDGVYAMFFTIYDAESGGTALWTDNKNVTVTGGLFSTLLGDPTPFPSDLFNGQNLWLGIRVQTDAEATPRQRLTPVAYAMFADNTDRLDGLDSSRYVQTQDPQAISGSNNSTPILAVTQSGTHDGIFAVTAATSPGRAAISGRAGSAGPLINGVSGVYGTAAASFGVVGTSNTGTGVIGFSSSSTGVDGQSTGGNGVRGLATSTSGRGVFGQATATSGAVYGVLGQSSSTNNGAGVRGEGPYVGVWGAATSTSAVNWGVYGQTNSANGFAGYFTGKVRVVGALEKSSGTFKIDHPLDPENKYLSHSFVESPDMLNVYNGNVTLDASGQAWVDMPNYFQALNRDFRYQLTPIGGPGPNLYIADQITNNRFRIAGGTPGLLVSWQVTGVRQDPYANANRVIVETNKPANERGSYLHPEVYGLDRSRSLDARYSLMPSAPAAPGTTGAVDQ